MPEESAEHASDVGEACLPSAVPEQGFDESETVVETGSRECATGACLVHNLAGDPRKPCGETSDDSACQSALDGTERRVTQVDVDDRVYCSCRCDAPEGDPGELCTCKRGFACVPTLLDAPPGVRGSYCIKDQTVSPWF